MVRDSESDEAGASSDCIIYLGNGILCIFKQPLKYLCFNVRREKNQQDATIKGLLLTSISTCFGDHYAHLQENKDPITASGVLFCNKGENVDISRDVFFVG
jgi:hypothetical protein